MSLLVFEWHEDNPHPVNLHHSPHVCANTDRMNKFLEENTVPPIGPILKHPWTGKLLSKTGDDLLGLRTLES